MLRLEGKSDNTNGFSWRIPKSSSFFEEGKPIEDEIIRFDTWTEWENQCAFSRLWGGMHYKDAVVDGVQVNLCQKHLFLHQLTHNMTTDCSLNYKFNT